VERSRLGAPRGLPVTADRTVQVVARRWPPGSDYGSGLWYLGAVRYDLPALPGGTPVVLPLCRHGHATASEAAACELARRKARSLGFEP
jgi:hypothetical protein